jgi:hypothetical protein
MDILCSILKKNAVLNIGHNTSYHSQCFFYTLESASRFMDAQIFITYHSSAYIKTNKWNK